MTAPNGTIAVIAALFLAADALIRLADLNGGGRSAKLRPAIEGLIGAALLAAYL